MRLLLDAGSSLDDAREQLDFDRYPDRPEDIRDAIRGGIAKREAKLMDTSEARNNDIRLPGLLDALEREYGTPWTPKFANPLEMVFWEAAGYLTDDAKRNKAFETLRTRVGFEPHAILETDEKDLEAITRIGGSVAPDLRAKRLKEASLLTVKEFEGDLFNVFKLPPKEAKKALMKFPMTGEPGAEKILMQFGVAPVLSLDSNALRVLSRLGFGEEEDNYTRMYRNLQKAAAEQLPEDCDALIRASNLLRHHGQEICKRGVPKCGICPVRSQCPYAIQLAAEP